MLCGIVEQALHDFCMAYNNRLIENKTDIAFVRRVLRSGDHEGLRKIFADCKTRVHKVNFFNREIAGMRAPDPVTAIRFFKRSDCKTICELAGLNMDGPRIQVELGRFVAASRLGQKPSLRHIFHHTDDTYDDSESIGPDVYASESERGDGRSDQFKACTGGAGFDGDCEEIPEE